MRCCRPHPLRTHTALLLSYGLYRQYNSITADQWFPRGHECLPNTQYVYVIQVLCYNCHRTL